MLHISIEKERRNRSFPKGFVKTIRKLNILKIVVEIQIIRVAENSLKKVKLDTGRCSCS